MGYNLCYKSVLTQKESHVEDEPDFKVRVKRKNQHKAKMVLSVALHHRHQNRCIFATMFIEAVLALKCHLCLSVKNTQNNKGITITETNKRMCSHTICCVQVTLILHRITWVCLTDL